MYEKILVPLDGSQISEAVLPYARFLSDKLKLGAAALAQWLAIYDSQWQ